MLTSVAKMTENGQIWPRLIIKHSKNSQKGLLKCLAIKIMIKKHLLLRFMLGFRLLLRYASENSANIPSKCDEIMLRD